MHHTLEKGDAEQQQALLRLHEVALETMSHGLCIFGADRRVVLFNRRFLAMYDMSPDVVRQGAAMEGVFMHGAAALRLTPEQTDEAWQQRQDQIGRGKPFSGRHRFPDGRVTAFNFRPMPDGGWVAVYEDVTKQQRMQSELRVQIDRMHQALRNLPLGLSMFDADRRLIVCNQQYLKLYGFDPDIVKPGAKFRDIAENWAVQGNEPCSTSDGITDDFLQPTIADQRRRRLTRSDGRVIQAIASKMPGGGWVTVSEDITSLLQADAALREQNARFDAALENMAQGLWMLDADLRMLVCNRRFIDMYGFDAEIVRPGISVLDAIRHSVALGNHGRADVARVYEKFLQFLYGEDDRAQFPQRDGRIFAVRKQPMPDGGWVVTYADVTETEQAINALRDQNVRFDAALNNMSQGLCMFDAENRLIVCNEQYVAAFDADPDIIKPGITLHEVFAHGVSRGLYADEVTADELVARRLAALAENRPVVYEQSLLDGRSLSITICPMQNGGWVGTYEDVTVRRAIEQDRAFALQQLSLQNLRFDVALNNMSHGLCMYDREHRIIVYNTQFLDIFGLAGGVVRHGTTLRELLDMSAAAGNYAERGADELYAEYLEKLKAGHFTMLRHLADGRVVNINCRSMPQGGWVATYEDITERHKTEERIAFMARHDSLTGLPNRVLFKEKMAEGLARAEVDGQSMAVLCLDLDNFKAVNDTLGHPIGDRLLTTVAQRLVFLLDEDTTMARLGGDEFAILQPGPQPGAAEALATKIIDVLSQPVMIDEHELQSGVSVGIAIAPNDGMLADHLMKCADLALYRAKADGRGKFRFFEPDMDARLQAKRALEQDLRKAIAAGEFSLVYQPQVRAASGELSGFETLLRWQHSTRGPVSPAEFIPIAEETGLIIPLGEWVLRHACTEAAKWPDSLRLAVNLSPVQFKSRGLVSMVTQALASARLPAERLELEITEAVLLQDEGGTRTALHQLRALGIRISMDDFGTGYSSLSYLRSFPFDKIKIDRSFVHDSDRKPDGLAIIRAMTSLGESLGIETTAEGVETPEQMELIRREGCSEAQGFLISKPLSPADAERFISAHSKHRAVA